MSNKAIGGAPLGGVGAFHGTERFELKQPLGVGGYGAVYAALDRQTGAEVALKVLRRMGPDALFRFKREFRALSDIHHPNLVRLGELFENEGHWFFTMERIPGPDLLDYVAPRLSDNDGSRRCDLARLRETMAQLADALAALHAFGKVHRDVKPTNVKVTPEGRVVLLDFGMVTSSPEQGQSTEADVLGTVAYMAPEQGSARRVGPEADFYALGVMLFEAVAGRLPFDGGSLQILMNKQRQDAPRMRDLAPDAPLELDELCAQLLSRDPQARPQRDEIVKALQAKHTTGKFVRAKHQTGGPTRSAVFLGRRRELDALHGAFQHSSKQSELVSAYVHGDSGLGKTALVEAFSQELRARQGELLVLAGRCYERETVPYKAFDGVIDRLARFLRKLDAQEIAALLPRHAASLGIVFPVLGSVQAIAHAHFSERQAQQHQASTARRALRDLLLRVADAYPLLVIIDDLHWADTESLQLLADLTDPRQAPAMMLVATGRPPRALPEDVAEAVENMLRAGEKSLDLQLRGLPPSEAEDLALHLMGREATSEAAQRIAAESEGHPLFIDLLVRYAREQPIASQSDTSRLDAALRHHIDALSPPARRLLQLLAVAGAPVPRLIAAEALALDPQQFAQHLAELRALRFVKQHSRLRGETVETFHERVRQGTVRALSVDQRRELHAALARALSASGNDDHEAISVHWREAGNPELARRFAVTAADRARQKLAFDKAARLYRQLLVDADDSERAGLLIQLAEVLALGGKSPQAADAYMQAQHYAPPQEITHLRRCAAEQLLRSGRFEEGRQVADQLLESIEVSVPEGKLGARLRIGWLGMRLRMRGLGYTPRASDTLPMSTLADIDTLWSLAPLSMVDPTRGPVLMARHVRAALDAGEPMRAQRAVAIEGLHRWPASKLTGSERDLQRRLRELATGEDTRSEHVRGLAHAALARRQFFLGELTRAYEHTAKAETIYVERCNGVRWELANVRAQRFGCAILLGRYHELRERVPSLLQEARELSDLYALGYLQVSAGWLLPLLDGNVQAAFEALDEGQAVWPQTAVIQLFAATIHRAQLTLLAGEPEQGLELLNSHWKPWSKHMLRLEVGRGYAQLLRGALLIACAAKASDEEERQRLGKRARRDLLTASRSPMAWVGPNALAKLGCLDVLLGQQDEGLSKLARAETQLRELHMPSMVLAIRRARALALGGEACAREVAEVDQEFRALGVHAPELYYRAYCPGLDSRGG